MNARMLLSVGVLGAALSSSGCFRMTITNGRPAAETPSIDGRWRSATALDVVRIDGPLPLRSERCGDAGWAKIEQRLTVLNWLADVFLAGILYESTTVDVYCATASPPRAPAPPTSSGTPSTAPPGSAPPTSPGPAGPPDTSL